MITIHYNSRTLNILPDDSSYRYRAIMGDNSVTLKFYLNTAIDFPVGSYVMFQGVKYTLSSPENWTRHGNSNIEYSMVFDGPQKVMRKYRLRNIQDGRLKFSMCSRPEEYLQLIIDNMNQTGRGTGWTKECLITAENKTVEFNHNTVEEALKAVADAFETEFEVTDDLVVRLGKVEYNKDNPLPLSYGRGNGFKPGTGRMNTSSELPLSVLYVQGGEQNIDRSRYGSQGLHLPKGKTLEYQGRTYASSADGMSISPSPVPHDYGNEGSLDLSDIYPKRVGTVSSVVVVDEDDHFYDFADNAIPDALNYNDCLISGEEMSVIFQTGMLAGKEFKISKYTHTTDGEPARVFEIVPETYDGIDMPSGTYIPAVGDKYAIFGCMLPDAYISDDDTQSGAEWDLFREAARYLHDRLEFKFTFKGEIQAKWARANWTNIGGRIRLGGFIRFSDTDFVTDGTDIRITGIKDYINSPYAPVVELSNDIATGGIGESLNEIAQQEVRIADNYRKGMQYTKRRWTGAIETMEALMDAKLEGFSEGISPIAIRTMQLLAGDESLQFRFLASSEDHTIVTPVSWDASTEKIVADAALLQHMTLGIGAVSASHAFSEYKTWNMPAFESAYLGDMGTQRFYVYAACPDGSVPTAQAGYRVSQTSMKMTGQEAGFYMFLVGILSTESEGERDFVTVYGYTEVLPGQISTDVIRSVNSGSVFDLANNRFKVGDSDKYIRWNENGSGALEMKGILNVTPSGSKVPFLSPRGAYATGVQYYENDMVTYGGSAYLCIKDLPATTSGYGPTNTTYWTKYVSKGTDGSSDPGPAGQSTFKAIVFKRSASTPSAPSGGTYASPVPNPANGWTSAVPSGTGILYMTTRIFTSDALSPQESAWGTPRKLTDNAEFSVVFSSVSNPGDPEGHPNTNIEWTDTADENTIWMATSAYSAGSWGAWEKMKIKGTKGSDGNRFVTLYAETTTEDMSLITGWSLSYSSTSMKYIWQCSGVIVEGTIHALDGTYNYPLNGVEYPDTRALLMHPYLKRSEDARNSIATTLGFSSWDDFESVTANGQVITSGGYLNALLIEAEAFLGKLFVSGDSTQQAIMTKDGFTLRTSGDMKTIASMTDIRYGGIDAFASVSSSQSTVTPLVGSVSATTQSETIPPGMMIPFYFTERDKVVNANSFTIGGTGTFTFSGSLKLKFNKGITGTATVEGATMYAYIIVEPTSGGTKYTLWSGAVEEETVAVFQRILPAGSYKMLATLEASYSFRNTGDDEVPMSVTPSLTVQANGTIGVVSVSEVTEIFANGFGYRKDANNYVAVVNATSGIEFEARRGNDRLRMDSNGFRTSIDGTNFFPLLHVELAAHFTCSGTSITKVGEASHTGNSVTATRSGTGIYQLTFGKSIGTGYPILISPVGSSQTTPCICFQYNRTTSGVRAVFRTTNGTATPSAFSVFILKI